MPTVSVIVASYNYGRYLGECVQSILEQQHFVDLELIVVDDCSTDNSLEVLDSFRDPRLVVVRSRVNGGHLRAMNEGFQRARGRYLAHVGADDRWRPTFLARTVPVLEAYPTIGLVHTNMALIDASGRITQERSDNIPVRDGFRGNELRWLLFENYFPPHGTLFRREALDAIGGGYPDAFPLSEDWRLWLNTNKRYESYFIDEVLVEYRVHERNLHSTLTQTRRGEASEMAVLDEFFSDPSLSADIRELAPRVYATHLRRHADRYFSIGKLNECRRCLARAARHDPSVVFSGPFLRRVAAMVIPSTVRRLLGRLRGPAAG